MKNETEWLELFDMYPFNDPHDARYDKAWKWVQELQCGGRLTRQDVFALQCLIEVCCGPAETAPPKPDEVTVPGTPLSDDDFRKIRFRLVWELAAENDQAREADKKGHPSLSLGDGWRKNAKETGRLIAALDATRAPKPSPDRVMGGTLPAGACSREYLEGWADGQADLSATPTSKKDFDWPKAIAAASDEVDRLQRELDITNADHILLWLEANLHDSSLGWLAGRIVEAHEALSATPDARLREENEALKLAAKAVVDNARFSFRSRGKDRYVEDDNGEQMVLVPHEDWDALRDALPLHGTSIARAALGGEMKA